MLQGGYSQPRGPFIEGVESETEDLKAKKEELERLQAEARAHEEEVKKQIADVKEFEKHQARWPWKQSGRRQFKKRVL